MLKTVGGVGGNFKNRCGTWIFLHRQSGKSVAKKWVVLPLSSLCGSIDEIPKNVGALGKSLPLPPLPPKHTYHPGMEHSPPVRAVLPLCREISFLWGRNPNTAQKTTVGNFQEKRILPLRGRSWHSFRSG